MSTEENKICGRLCMLVKGSLCSPLLIGSGEEEKTNMDMLVTKGGKPFIPGSAMAGVLRNYMEECDAKDMFGDSGWTNEQEGELSSDAPLPDYQSRVFVYDSVLENGRLVSRDGIRLKEDKTCELTSKYDMQAVEPGAKFVLRLEVLVREREKEKYKGVSEAFRHDLELLKECLYGMKNGSLRLGAKTTRGFGAVDVTGVVYRTFFMENKEEFKQWLDWDWNREKGFEQGRVVELDKLQPRHLVKEHCLKVPLKITNTILVRKYNMFADEKTGEKTDKKKTHGEDYGQLALNDGTAVLPGSSIAGAVRSYVAELVQGIGELSDWHEAQRALEPFFGTWQEEQRKAQEPSIASRICFDETYINGGERLFIVRNAVDRFTGGSAASALYEESVWAGGNVELKFRWRESGLLEQEKKALIGMLLWAVFGLQNGFLPLGGETGVGRGIFESAGNVTLDDKPVEDEERYLMAAAGWCRCLKEDKDGKNTAN